MSAVSSGYIVPYFSVRSSGASTYPYRLLVVLNVSSLAWGWVWNLLTGRRVGLGRGLPSPTATNLGGPPPRYIWNQNDLFDSRPLIIIRKKGDCERSGVVVMPCAVSTTRSRLLLQHSIRMPCSPFFFTLNPRDMLMVKSLKSIGLPSWTP